MAGGGSHAEVVSSSSSECTEAPIGVMANASGPCSLRQGPVGLEGYVVSTDIIRFLAFYYQLEAQCMSSDTSEVLWSGL